jgi:predicted ATP-grasp superfamily ATP-dependent carboligase
VRILAYEHVTGGGMAGDPRMPAWAPEGDAMLRALVDDLRLIPGVEVLVLRDPRLAQDIPGSFPAPDAAREFRPAFRDAVLACDAVWPIAPETDGILLDITNDILDCGRTVLNSRPDAVRVASSKRATHALLERHDIPSIPCFDAEDAIPMSVDAVVVKPDDGAGCLETHLFRDRSALRGWLRKNAAADCVLQPYVAGEPRSLSLVCGGGQGRLLACNRQRIAMAGGALRFEGVDVGAVKDDDGAYAKLAARLCEALPGLWGYCGVDIVETADGPTVVEINPRLTTSYVGLRQVTACNPAALVLAMMDSASTPKTTRSTHEPAVGASDA